MEESISATKKAATIIRRENPQVFILSSLLFSLILSSLLVSPFSPLLSSLWSPLSCFNFLFSAKLSILS
jgi:hypothetical protein